MGKAEFPKETAFLGSDLPGVYSQDGNLAGSDVLEHPPPVNCFRFSTLGPSFGPDPTLINLAENTDAGHMQNLSDLVFKPKTGLIDHTIFLKSCKMQMGAITELTIPEHTSFMPEL